MKDAFIATFLFCASLMAEDPPNLPNRDPKGASPESPNPNITSDHFVHLKPFDIPVLQENSVKGYVGVTITFEAKTPEMAKELQAKMPVVRDRIIYNVYSILYLLWEPDFTPDEGSIKRYIEKSIEESLQADLIQAIYLKDFYVRKDPTP